MHVLLTNDDGIGAPGMAALIAALKPLCRLTVVAPHRQRSASGIAITLHRSIPVRELPPQDGIPMYACDGTPADCAMLGLRALAEGPIDLVVSGINDGANLGEDILHSGTVGAAIEACMAGTPAMAISSLRSGDGSPTRYDGASLVAARLVRLVQTGFELPEGVVLNVNVPALPVEQLAGVAITKQGGRAYTAEIRTEPGLDGARNYWVYGPATDPDDSTESDVGATKAGLVAITPVTAQLTARETMSQLREADDLHRLLHSD